MAIAGTVRTGWRGRWGPPAEKSPERFTVMRDTSERSQGHGCHRASPGPALPEAGSWVPTVLKESAMSLTHYLTWAGLSGFAP